MSAEFEGDSQINPDWERLKVLGAFEDIAGNQFGNAAFGFTKNMESVTMFSGIVKPLQVGEEVYYEGLRVHLAMYSSLDGRNRRARVALSKEPFEVHAYILQPDELQGNPNMNTAMADMALYDILQRTTFFLGLAQLAVSQINS